MSIRSRLALLTLLSVSSFAALGCGGGGGGADAGNQPSDGSVFDNGQTADDGGLEDGATADMDVELTPEEMCEATCDTCVQGFFQGGPRCPSSDFGCGACQGGTGTYTPNFLINCEVTHQACQNNCAGIPGEFQAQCNSQCSASRVSCLQSGEMQCASSCNTCFNQLVMCVSAANPA
jgi:hypothetical protein